MGNGVVVDAADDLLQALVDSAQRVGHVEGHDSGRHFDNECEMGRSHNDVMNE